jgi:hypothetical protein
MTGWFRPPLLAKLLLRAIVSDLFGQYADRRLVHAALDGASTTELLNRADFSKDVATGDQDVIWIDYVADLGDGFDATYAIAYLLAQRSIAIEGHPPLPRGEILIMGGDEVYPTAKREDYIVKLRKPYGFAFPDIAEGEHPPVLLLPGNHDWYDGLGNFLAIFCRQKSTPIGGWRTRQRRSYFAAKLNENWWIWCIDIALVRDVDQPQADYFVAIAGAMAEHANIVLCSAEPGWYKADSDGDSYRTLSYAAWIAQNAEKDLRIPLVLSGDSHHYARYSAEGVQFMTSGGGGAFVHGTLELKDEIKTNWLKHDSTILSLKTAPTADHGAANKQACYPTQEESRSLLNKNVAFVFKNPGFSFFLGGIYGALALALTALPRWDVALLVFLALFGGFFAYTGYQERFDIRIALLSCAHALVHLGAVLIASWWLLLLGGYLWPIDQWHWLAWFVFVAVLSIGVGGPAAGTIFGLYLLATCRWFGINHNDAFSAMKLDSHRHFLRIRIQGDTLEVYPVAVDRVPARHEWRENPQRKLDPTASVFVPPDTMVPRLIEGPIVIQGRFTPSTQEMKDPADLPSVPAR